MDQPNALFRQREHVASGGEVIARISGVRWNRSATSASGFGEFGRRKFALRRSGRAPPAHWPDSARGIDRIRLACCCFPDLVLVLDIGLGACETIELLCEPR